MLQRRIGQEPVLIEYLLGAQIIITLAKHLENELGIKHVHRRKIWAAGNEMEPKRKQTGSQGPAGTFVRTGDAPWDLGQS